MADPYYANVSMLLPMNGANNGTVFTDYSPTPKTVTRYGDAKTVTAQSKYYGSSGYFDGTGDYLSVPDNAEFELAGGEFTADAWVYLSGYSNSFGGFYAGVLIGKDVVGARSWHFKIAGTSSSYTSLVFSTAGTELTASYTFSLNTWYHVAVCKSGTSLRFFVNGAQVGTTQTHNTTIANTAAALTVGTQEYTGYTYNLKGYLQDVRLTMAARYTADFTPPARLLKSVSGTIFDTAGAPCSRDIHFYHGATGNKLTSVVSEQITGKYEAFPNASGDEVFRVVMANEPSLYNHIIDRVMPE